MEKRKYEHPGSDSRESAACAHDELLDAAASITSALRYGGSNTPVGEPFRAKLKTAQKKITDAHEWIARALAQQEYEAEWWTTETDI